MTGVGPTPAQAVWFTAPRTAEILDAAVPPPGPGEATVRAVVSLVSAGTELSVYRGEASGELGLETCAGSFDFPVKYGYQVVGEVLATGGGATVSTGDTVFVFHPHQTHFTVRTDGLLVAKVPPDLAPERAAFAHLLSVALTSQLDVPTRFADCVVVFGQGVVGCLAAQLVRRTAGRLVVVDPIESRRQRARLFGADAAVGPDAAAEAVDQLSGGRGADAAIEASGSPAALQCAIEVTGQAGTIVAVSYFGTRVVPLVLAPQFHFRRQRIVSSQTNPFGGDFGPRWDWPRVQGAAFDLLRSDWLQTPVTHRVPFLDAARGYQLLDQRPDEAMSVVFEY